MTNKITAVFVLILIACSNQDGAEEKVILLNIRGTSYPALVDYLKTVDQGFLSDALQQNRLKELIPVENAVTAVNMASFETGTTPDQHGIVGHLFADPDAKIKAKSGFNTFYETETIWELASKASLNVLTVGSLVMHGKKRVHANVDMIAQGEQMGSAKFWDLTVGSSKEVAGYEYVKELKSANQTKLQLNDSTHFYLYLANSIFDGNEERLILIADSDTDFSNGTLFENALSDWSIWSIKKDPYQISTRFKVLNWNPELGKMRLFARAPFMNKGKPADFVEQIETKIGQSTGWLSLPEYFAGKIDDQILREEIAQEVDYVISISTDAIQSEAYDLISIDYPLLDRYGHIYTVSDLRQKDYDKREFYQKFRLEAYQRLDRDLAQILKLAEENQYRLVIASGHGFSAIHSSININRLFSEAGYRVDGDNWQIKAFPGKVAAHIYLNDKQISSDSRSELIAKIETLFRELKDPADNSPVLEKFLLKSQMKSADLNHLNSGDMWALLKPGYVFQAQIISERPLFDKPMFRGDHGYSANLEESKGVFIFDEELENKSYPVTDIAKLVHEILGIETVFKAN